MDEKNAAEAKLKRFVEKGDGWIELMIPIITVSEGNGGAKVSYKRNGKTCYKTEHWSDKHRRTRLQKGTVALMLRPHRDCLSIPCHIMLTRYAPRELDVFENLPMSFKYIVDAICEIITNDYVPGRADSRKGIKISCDQVVSKEYGVKVRIQKC